MCAAMERVPCIVPFCRRTARAEKHPGSEEIICGKHWRCIPLRIRRHRRILNRRHAYLQKRWDKRLGGREQFDWNDYGFCARIERLMSQIDRLWRRNWETCKCAAIEGALGT